MQIPENPNPKSGIMPGSCSFEEMLSAVADFKAPVSEPGGSMQQGMYTPKGEPSLIRLWLLIVFCQVNCVTFLCTFLIHFINA